MLFRIGNCKCKIGFLVTFLQMAPVKKHGQATGHVLLPFFNAPEHYLSNLPKSTHTNTHIKAA